MCFDRIMHVIYQTRTETHAGENNILNCVKFLSGLVNVTMACHVLSEAAVDGNSKSSERLQKRDFPSDALNGNGDSLPGAPEQLKKKCSEYKLKSSHAHLRRHRDRNLYCLKRKGTESFAKLDRFNRTILALQCSGLFEISTGIFQLVRDSDSLQKEINKLQEETVEFNRRLIEQQFKGQEQSAAMSKELGASEGSPGSGKFH